MSETLVVDVSHDRGELGRVAATAEALGERENWPPALLFKVNLALEELVLNVLTHGYHGGMSEVKVTLTSDDDAVSIEITDDGVPFDPTSDAPEPDVSAAIEDRKVGGLGLHLVMEMVDEASYSRTGGRNRLTLKLLRDG